MMFSLMCGSPDVHSDVFDAFDSHKSCETSIVFESWRLCLSSLLLRTSMFVCL